jgi:hypothetical protein
VALVGVVAVQTQQQFKPLQELPILAAEVGVAQLQRHLGRLVALALSSFVTLLTALHPLLQQATLR